MVRNSIAIQYGRDPTNARIRFYWKQAKGRPRSFFPEPRASCLWPTHGLLLHEGLFIFALKVRMTNTGLGFDVFGAVAIHITNPQAEPDRWTMNYLAVPVEAVEGDSIVNVAAMLSDSSYLYVWLASDERHDVYLARWRRPLKARRELPRPEWLTAEGWAKADGAGPKPLPQFPGANDFSVQTIDSAGGLLQVQTVGFGQARVCYRTADRITGPWSESLDLFTPAECSVPRVLIYSANSHPELEGADVVITYNVNSLDLAELTRNHSIYYPRFLRAKLVSADSQLK